MIDQPLSDIIRYCLQFSSQPDEILIELERETHLKTMSPQMMTGPLQGQLLSILSHMKNPENILEIGTFTGYGTICLARGLSVSGKVYTIEINREMKIINHAFFKKAGIADRVVYLEGDAKEILPTLDLLFDIVYIDAAKQDYGFYYQTIKNKMNKGGIILADNVLWSGKVLQPNKDKETTAIQAFNEMIANDEEVKAVILPVRDGLTVIRIL